MVGGLATAVQDLKTVVTKTGFDCGDASYFLELLCVNDYDDRNKPLTENRPSTAGVGKRYGKAFRSVASVRRSE